MNTLPWILCLALYSCVSTAETAAYQTHEQCKPTRTWKHQEISRPPNIAGSWFSPSCEMQPGPQYVLRHYKFSLNEFTIIRYYFSDEFCKEPIYSIMGEGTIAAQNPSWYLYEATDMDVYLTNLTLKPYKTDVSMVLARIVQGGCHGFSENKDIFNGDEPLKLNASDQTCLQSLSFSVNELLVMRQVNYYKRRSNSLSDSNAPASLFSSQQDLKRRHKKMRKSLSMTERELFLGNGVWYSQLDRPSSYQSPLYSHKHKHCEACVCIAEADVNHPPVRCHSKGHHATAPPANLTGHWSSDTCESAPYSLFTLRSYTFNEEDATFDITTHYYTDTSCTRSSFTLTAKGRFIAGESHNSLHNTRAYQFIFDNLLVGVLSETMAELLSMGDTARCGHIKHWELGKMYDVTESGGCDSLNIVVQESQFVLIKSEIQSEQIEYLIMSEMKSSQSAFSTQVTHFTPKLKKCNSKEEPVPVGWSAFKAQRLTQSSSSKKESLNFNIFLLAVTFGVVFSI